jgi:hypothetical protein
MLTARAAANTLINVGPFSTTGRAQQTRPDARASNGLMKILLQQYPPSKIEGLRLPAQETPIRMHHPARLGYRGRSVRALWVPVLLAATVAASACSDDPDPGNNPSAPTPTAITETFEGTVTVNGANTHPFIVLTAGTVVARVTALEPAEAVIGLSIGTWNGATCSVVLANDNATTNASVTGSATTTGNYCARVYDVGKLTAAVPYQITVTHF